MKIITKKNANKIAEELTKQIKLLFISRGIKSKEKDFLQLKRKIVKSLGG